MKKLALLSAFSFLLLQSCGLDGIFANKTDEQEPEQEVKAVKKADTAPHEVRKGRVASYSFSPDTAVNKLVIGNPESLGAFIRDYGMHLNPGDVHLSAFYLTADTSERMEVKMAKNAQGQMLVYALSVKKLNEEDKHFKWTPLRIERNNFVTGNSIYLGMSFDYVQIAYTDQAMMQWEKGDTLYLQYKPKEKDAKEFHRYSWKSYTATYKFVDFRLRSMEYTVDPAEFEGH